MPTVVLADDHPSVLAQVRAILADDFEVVAAVNNGLEAVQAAMDYKPDLIILDITMPGLDGVHTAREIRRLHLPSKLIFLSLHEDSDYLDAAHAIHASYVVKSRMNDDLSVAIKEEFAGKLFFSPIAETPHRH
jgi:DNA-binding NarL/FixJ family response regulator